MYVLILLKSPFLYLSYCNLIYIGIKKKNFLATQSWLFGFVWVNRRVSLFSAHAQSHFLLSLPFVIAQNTCKCTEINVYISTLYVIHLTSSNYFWYTYCSYHWDFVNKWAILCSYLELQYFFLRIAAYWRSFTFIQKTMQLFVRGSETHALQLAGNETVSDIKVIVLERVRHRTRKTPTAIRPIKKLCLG